MRSPQRGCRLRVGAVRRTLGHAFTSLPRQITSAAIAMAVGMLALLSLLNGAVKAKSETDPSVKAYVGIFKDNAVAVLDTATNHVLGTISIPPGPNGMVTSPDGRRVYVSSDGASTVSVIDTTTDKVVGAFEVGQSPNGLAITPDGTTLLVAVFGANQVVKVNTATGKITGIVPIPMPHTIAIMPGGRVAFVTAQKEGSTSLVELDIPQMTVLARIPFKKAPRDSEISPNGRQLYLTLAGIDALQVISTANNRLIKQIPVGASPHQPLFTPRGDLLLLVVQGPGELTLIDPRNTTVSANIPVGIFPHWVATSPDGRTAYVTNEGSNDLSVVDLVARRVTATIPIGNGPRKIVLATAGRDPAVSIAQFAFHPATLTIKAGESVTWTNKDAVPHTVTAEDKSWDSGSINPGATYQHTFAKPGTYAYFCTIHPQMRGKIIVK